MPPVNIDILKWARETAGLSTEQAAKAIGIGPARGRSASQRLESIEVGEEAPSRTILNAMSRIYRRPLLLFYLNQRPRAGDRGQDFRTLPGHAATPLDPNLDALIRDLRARQQMVRELLEEEDAPPLRFVGSAKMTDSPNKVASSIITTIGFNLDEYRGKPDTNRAFAYLRNCIESAGVFVLLVGDLGSHHTAFPVEEFRGFAIADNIAPFIVVNSHDAPVTRPFTALHELTHVWLGTTGVSSTESDSAIEIFCNKVTGEILLPELEMAGLRSVMSETFDTALEAITDFARERHVSRAMVAYKLYILNIIDLRTWRSFDVRIRQDWINQQAQTKNVEKQRGGQNYYKARQHGLGKAIMGVVERSIGEGRLSPTKAGKILGVKVGNVNRLLSRQ